MFGSIFNVFLVNFGAPNGQKTTPKRLPTSTFHGKPKNIKFDDPLNENCCFSLRNCSKNQSFCRSNRFQNGSANNGPKLTRKSTKMGSKMDSKMRPRRRQVGLRKPPEAPPGKTMLQTWPPRRPKGSPGGPGRAFGPFPRPREAPGPPQEGPPGRPERPRDAPGTHLIG